MARSNARWVADLRDPQLRNQASGQLHGFLRGTLARGFGNQLSDADLDDLAQDSVVRVVQRLDDFRDASRFTTWAAAISVNAALGELRKRRHAARSFEQLVELGRSRLEQLPTAPAHLQRDEATAVLRTAIDEVLTAAQREALLAELGGLTLMEIARRTGRKRGALYKLLHDARKRLRASLEARGYGAADLLQLHDAEVNA